MEATKIILFSMAASICYGIAHDQVTARVCVEYFTIGHPAVFGTDSPTLLAFGWGIIATWWMGVLLGVPTALCSRLGSWPKADVTRLYKPVAVLLMVMAIASLGFGLVGYYLAQSGSVWLLEPMKSAVPADRHTVFLADLWAHSAAYGFGFLGGLACCGWILMSRHRESKLNDNH